MSKSKNDPEGEFEFMIGRAFEKMPAKRIATVTIASRRRLLVESLTHQFSLEPGFLLVDFAKADAEIHKPAVCILETGEHPVEAYRRRLMIDEVGKRLPSGSVLILSGCREESEITDWLEAGAHGYCSTGSSLAMLVAAVHVVAAGGVFLPSDLARRLLKQDLAHAVG